MKSYYSQYSHCPAEKGWLFDVFIDYTTTCHQPIFVFWKPHQLYHVCVENVTSIELNSKHKRNS